jgi:hypothetical protein
MSVTPTTPTTAPPMTPPDPSVVLSGALVAELVRSLDMTAEFLRLASPRVRTELSAYLGDFHPHIERDELIDLLGNRAVELYRLAHQHTQHPDASTTGVSSCPA